MQKDYTIYFLYLELVANMKVKILIVIDWKINELYNSFKDQLNIITGLMN